MDYGIGSNYHTLIKVLWDTPELGELKKDLINLEELVDLPNKVTLRKEAYAYLSKLILKGKICPDRIIQTGFFQGMCSCKRSCQFSKKIEMVALNILSLVDDKHPTLEIKQWLSNVLWDVLPRDQLVQWTGSPVLTFSKPMGKECEFTFPEIEWEVNAQSNWDFQILEGIRNFVKKQKSQSLMIIQGGKMIDQCGDVSEKHLVHSCRKSFLSALFGIYVELGVIDLSKTLVDLGVDDVSSLTQKERFTTLLDMIRSRSGIYHPAAYETQGMKEARPRRGSHQPGEFWYYNNWDFNTLGKIFEELTGISIFEAIKTHFAIPIGMQDFQPSDGIYGKEPESEYPSYDFAMSARDMARFGYLFLREGNWKGYQIIPKDWVRRSTLSYTQGVSTERNPFYGYGFMWWTNEMGYYALGYGGHAIAVIPSKDLVIVHRMANDDDDDTTQPMITPQATHTLLRMIIDAAP